MRGEFVHHILHNIVTLLSGCTAIMVWHVYRDVNSVADWVTFYIVEHS